MTAYAWEAWPERDWQLSAVGVPERTYTSALTNGSTRPMIGIGGPAAPPTPPGIRATYHGGSIGLSRIRNVESGQTE